MPYLLIAHPWDSAAAALRPLYFSDVGLTTGAADSPPHTYFLRRIEAALKIKRSLYSGVAIGGWTSTAFGAVTLANDDGELDWLGDLEWDGRVIEIRYAAAETVYGEFVTLFRGPVEQIVLGDEISLELRDPQEVVDVPAAGRGVFAGTGGVEGPGELKDRQKPFLLGRRRQIEPVLIDAADSIYLVDSAGIYAIRTVRDGGVPLVNFAGDTANFAALKALPLTGGQWATCLSSGLLRLGVSPLGRLTIDADGVMDGGVWISCFADLARHALLSLGGLSPDLLDSANFAAMATLCPHVQGYYYNGGGAAPSTKSLIDQLAADVGGYWGVGLDYKLRLGRFDGPAAIAAAAFSPRDILDIKPRPVARRLKKQRLGWRPYDVVMTDAEMDNATPEVDRIHLRQAYRWVEALDAAVAATNLLAIEEESETSFDAEAAAVAEAQRRLAVFGPRRKAFDVSLSLSVARAASLAIGQTIELSDVRYGLSAALRCVILEIEEDAVEEIVNMTVIG